MGQTVEFDPTTVDVIQSPWISLLAGKWDAISTRETFRSFTADSTRYIG